MNVDTDTQYAFTRPVADHMFKNYDGVLKVDGEVGNKKAYDPRAWGKAAEAGMAARVVEACEDLRSAGHPDRLMTSQSLPRRACCPRPTCSASRDPAAGRRARPRGPGRRRGPPRRWPPRTRRRAWRGRCSPSRRWTPAAPSRPTPTPAPATTAASTRCAAPAGAARARCRGSTRRTRASCGRWRRCSRAAGAIGETRRSRSAAPPSSRDCDPPAARELGLAPAPEH